MDNIRIAKVCGLCAGCKHAINTAKNELSQAKNVVIFKEIVHNENVNNMLKKLGAQTKNDILELTSNDYVILRAHGEPPETYEYLNSNQISFSDCTCVNVQNIHTKVLEAANEGYQNIILGKHKSKLHPEVLGTNGWTNYSSILIEDENDIAQIQNSPAEKFYLTCQTTFNEKKADDLIFKISNLISLQNKELIVQKTICGAQKAINKSSVDLAKEVDIMLVVGSSNSSNTVELFNNVKTFVKCVFIDKLNNWKTILKNNNIFISKDTKIGITAGASAMREDLEFLKNQINNHLENSHEYQH